MTRAYATFALVQRRVDVLKQSGIWPGIRCRRDGTYTLTYDPESGEQA